MATYRIFFRNSSGIVGRHDFIADDDEAAVAMAEVLCDACSDRCDSFGLWIGDHCIAEQPRPLTVTLSLRTGKRPSSSTKKPSSEVSGASPIASGCWRALPS